MAVESVPLAWFPQTQAPATLVVFALHHGLETLLTQHPGQLGASISHGEKRGEDTRDPYCGEAGWLLLPSNVSTKGHLICGIWQGR